MCLLFLSSRLDHRHRHLPSASSVVTETQHEANLKSCAVSRTRTGHEYSEITFLPKAFSVSFESSVRLDQWQHFFAFTC